MGTTGEFEKRQRFFGKVTCVLVRSIFETCEDGSVYT